MGMLKDWSLVDGRLQGDQMHRDPQVAAQYGDTTRE
jgi:hypothetical protein